MTNLRFLAAVVAVVLGFTAESARANALFTFSPGQPDTVNTGLTLNIGNHITTGALPLNVNHIGAWVGPDQAAGLTTVPFIADLYNNSGLVNEVSIPVGTPVNSQGFAYVPYTTTMTAFTAYALADVAVDGNGNAINTPFAYRGNGGPAGTWDGVTFDHNIFLFSPSPAWALANGPGNTNPSFAEFVGANLQFTPEPSSFILCGFGALGLLVAARRRRKA